MVKPTLGQVFAASLTGLALVLALLFYIVFDGSRRAITESSKQVRDGAAGEIANRVSVFLAGAPDAAEQFQRFLKRSIVDSQQPETVEKALLTLLLSNQELGEVAFTCGVDQGFDDTGLRILAATPRWQVSVFRTGPEKKEGFRTQIVRLEGGVFIAEERETSPGAAATSSDFTRKPGTPADPTQDFTFETPARQQNIGQPVWSDPHWLEWDKPLPETARRVEVSVQQSMTDPSGKFAGVLRVGLLTQQLDRAVQFRLAAAGDEDPHRIFICDAAGRLITRIHPEDRLKLFGNDLRIAPANLPAEIAKALADPKLRAVSEETPSLSGRFSHEGQDYLTTFRRLPGTQDWIVGIVVPEVYYLGQLVVLRDRLLALILGVVVLILVVGGLVLRGVKRALSRIVKESVKMNTFDFSPAPTRSAFRDVHHVLESLEQAKTAMRAMGKYVPVDLVQRLYRERSEPVLGGELMEISIMFTDIKGFTTLSEEMTPDQLANALGLYLDVMARIIQNETHGTIDKYIGDAIMTLWNAPEPVADHPLLACRAALRCRDAGRALAQTAAWGGLPPFETRFGLHMGPALVGHFGAHNRMNYTAIGDAINLASRLEGQNKQYGTTIIASESVHEAVKGQLVFRLLDVVAVKGKNQAVRIYEVLGEKVEDVGQEVMKTVAVYETAFARYLARDFAGAREALETQESDPPSAALKRRCEAYLRDPPPEDWNGVHVAEEK